MCVKGGLGYNIWGMQNMNGMGMDYGDADRVNFPACLGAGKALLCRNSERPTRQILICRYHDVMIGHDHPVSIWDRHR
ncbi:hypothetical protein SAMN04489760_15110 [Syntrophus gentianae]|uniref:Uncharacterized protein n=1 Tax=Syntrophus gentianae TaxID=43775 RepID=A0A1H8BDY5_9BACT|nr:hypothetical protein SAMN04489760_15110 [Syntrophus gentianae]